jgi:hypothetical protein
VLVSKYADHLPLYRQAEIYAREGVELDRSPMADWVGQVSWRLQPLVEHIRAHVFAADKIHTDDTPVPVLAPGTGRTRTGRVWVYARDDRGWQGTAPPAVAYFYTPDRRGERPRSHLAGFSGFLQADGYAGYEQLCDGRGQPGPIVEVACWAHVRRKIYDVWKATGSTTARAGVKMVDAMYQMEELARGLPLDQRLDRRQVVRVGVNGFFNWAEDAMRSISAKSALADAIRYAVKRREALTRFCDDARLEADNNRAENCLRPVGARPQELPLRRLGQGRRASRGDLHAHRDSKAQLRRPGSLAAVRAHPHRGRAPGQAHRRTRAMELDLLTARDQGNRTSEPSGYGPHRTLT